MDRHAIARGNLFAAVPGRLIDEEFTSLMDLSNDNGGRVLIERIVSRQHHSPEGYWYDQKQTEWVLVIRGSAVLEFQLKKVTPIKGEEEEEDRTVCCETIETIDLSVGDYVCIPPHMKHRVAATDPMIDTIWLAVHVFPPDLAPPNE